MKSMLWMIVAIGLIGLILLGGCSKGNNVVRIGFIGPLTGDAVIYGEPIRNAVSLAVEEINNKGGINGKQIQIIYEDGKCNGKDSATAAQKLINIDKVKIIIGGLCSGETLGAAPIAEENRVILFSTGSGSPDITNAGDYIFRNFPSDASSGKKMAEVAIKKSLNKVALLVENTDYAQAIKKVFTKRFKELGGGITTDESFSSDENDLRTQITKIKSTNPNAVYFIPQTPQKIEIAFKQFMQLGLNVQVLSNELINSEAVLKSVGEAVEGTLYAEPAFDENKYLAKQLLDKYKEKYGSLGAGIPPVYLATAYDAIYIFKELIEKYSEDDVEAIKDGLYEIQFRDGAAGRLTMDQNGDAVFEYVVKIIKNGKPEEVKI